MLAEIQIQMTPVILWLVLLIVFVAVELITVGLVSIWLAAGALIALIVAAVGGPFWLQVVLFFVVSALALVVTRPLARRYINRRVHPTNADSLVGEIITVKETVDNRAETGMAVVHGQEWTLRSSDDKEVLPKDSLAKVVEIKGVKLIVEKYKEE